MEKLLFKVKIKRKLSLDWSLKTIQKYPLHEHNLYSIVEQTVLYEFNPTNKLNINELKIHLKFYLMERLNAYEVIEIKK